MNEPHDPNQTADLPSIEADSLDAGLAAGFGRPSNGPGGVLSELRSRLGPLNPVLLKEAAGESAHVVKPKSDAMPPPEQIGDRYQLSGEIARGGMGAVLRGRDVDLGRDLAVKVLLEKHASRPEVARRFIEEAQIGGQLQHPGVVPVYDIGRFGDRPFFTMKLIKGKTLAALLSERDVGHVSNVPDEEQARWKRAPQDRRDVGHVSNVPDEEQARWKRAPQELPRLLSIALRVAQTLAYAHAKGVIHRDLKPANIMVGAFGEVQVMDWGLAKVLAEGGVADEERASRQHQEPVDVTTIRTVRSSGSAGSGTDTQAGSLLGTPAYMPPEQANGDVALLDRRADVFGLGAILCEILTGKPPYLGRSFEEVRRKAANGELADAWARLDDCGADGELIVLTKSCLSPEAIDRPKDAQAVAEGLTAYLDGVQQRLHQAELAEAEARATAVEEAKRRRLTLALAGTVLLALTVGGGGWLYLKTQRDARYAQLTREVNETLNKVTALREQARIASAGGAALFAQAREQAQRALALVESGPADDTLKNLVAHLQTELDEEEKDRRLIAALDEARLAQAETLAGESRFASERAVPKFREAFRTYGLPAGEGEPKVAAERIRQRPAAVREAILAALDEWDNLAGNPEYKISEPHREWLRAVLEAAEPDDAWGRKVRAARRETDAIKRQAALEALAKSAKVAELPALALTRLAGGLSPPQKAELLRRAQRQYPADFWVNENLGSVLQKVMPPEREEAVRFLTAAVALRPESPGIHLNLGNALAGKGQWDAAIACYNKAIALDPKFAVAHSNLGSALHDKGQWDKAIACFKKAIELDPKYAMAHNNLGFALKEKGQWDAAISCYKKAIELDPKEALAHYNLGNALDNKRQLDEAIACWKKAIALDPKDAKVHNNLGYALKEKGQWDEAIAYYNKAITLDPKDAVAYNGLGAIFCDVKRDYDAAIAYFHKAIARNPKDAVAHYNLGNALHDKGQLDEAIAEYKKAIALDPTLAKAHSNLGFALHGKGQLDAAIAEYKKAIELDPKFAMTYYNLGLALYGKGQWDKAIACFKKAIELDPKYARAHNNLGVALKEKGQWEEAIVCFQRAIALDPKHTAAQSGLAQAQRLAAVQGKLAALRKGDFKPSTNDERLGLSEICTIKKLYRMAAGQYADAFAADAKLANDLTASHRYNAACYAALAAAGQGEDAAKLDAKERARLRKQALDWLRADLALRTRQLESGQAADRAEVRQQMMHWQQDSDLAAIRDKAALAQRPVEERQACQKLWADVAALLEKTQSKK